MAGYIGPAPVPQATQTREVFTLSSTQTTVGTGGYTPGFVDVYLNGAKLAPADFTATNGSDIVLASAAVANDILEVVAFQEFTVVDQTFSGDITFTGANYNLVWDASDDALEFRDTALKISSSADGQLDLDADTEIEITAPTVQVNASSVFDVNGNIDVSGTGLVTGVLTTTAQVVQNGGFDSNDASTVIAADGAADNQFALQIQNLESTNDRSYGLYIRAGTTVTDSPLHIYDYTGSTQLFRVTGTGQTLFTDGSESLPSITNIGDTNTGIFFPAADTIAFSEGGSEAMRITSDGNVGIGTTAPHDAGSNFNMLTLNGAKGGGIVFSDDDVNQHMINTTDDASLRFSRGANLDSETMRIDSSGRVGIAQDTPGDFSASADDLVVGNSSGARGITIRSSSSSSGNLFFADGVSGNQAYRGYIQYSHDLEQLNIGAAGDDRVIIDSSGNTTIGGVVKGSNGSNSAPTFSFSNDTDTGMYLSSTGYLAFTAAGTKSLEIGGGIIYTAANGAIRSATNSGSLTLSGGGATVGGQILLRGGEAGGNEGDIVFKAQKDTTSPTERMRIDASGGVSIGTGANATGIHSSAKVLEISGGDGGDLIIGNNTSSNIGAGAHIGAIAFKNIDDTSGTEPLYAGIRCEAVDTTGNMDLRFYTGTGNLEADTPQVIIDRSGNLGIGVTTALLNPLEVNVTANTNTKSTGSAFDGAAVRLNATQGMQSTGSEIALLAGGNDSLQAGFGFMRESNTTWGTSIKFYNHEASTSGATDDLQEVMRIDSSGNVLVGGTDTNPIGNHIPQVMLNGTGGSHFMRDNGVAIKVGRNDADECMEFFRQGNTQGGISLTSSGVTYNSDSDYRLKENVTYNWDATTRLQRLKPAQFNFISVPDETMNGFLAHEVEAIVPDAVSGAKDAVDEDGNIKAQRIDHSRLVPLLVKTIQELEARITALEAGS